CSPHVAYRSPGLGGRAMTGEIRVVIVTDDRDAFGRGAFEAERWCVEQVGLTDANALIAGRPLPSLFLLHVPDVDRSTAMCAAIRRRGETPIMLASRRSGQEAEDELVAALRAGANAFVHQSIGRAELVARARSLLRRTMPAPLPDEDRIVVGP